jgi:hypothetical protein
MELPGVHSRSLLSPIPTAKCPSMKLKDIRELIENSYRIIYRVKQDLIDVPTVIHNVPLLTRRD